jgi:hypothetical protein
LADTAAAREFRSSDYQLFAEQQQRAAAVLPKTWEWLQRSPTRDDDFMGITLTFRGRRIIYHPKDAETLPIPRREKQGAREQVTVTIWPANYRPHRTNAIEQLRTFGEAGDSPEPIAGDDRIKITAEANFDSTTTASTWPTWKADLIRALKLRALPPSPRQLQQEERERSLSEKMRLDTPQVAIAWAEAQMRQAKFIPSAKPYVEDRPQSFIIYWPRPGGFDAILIVGKISHNQQFFVFGGGLKKT